MAHIAPQLRAWAWFTRRVSPIATMSDADIIAFQRRRVPANVVTHWLLGTVPQGIETTNRTIPGPASDIPVRIYRRSESRANDASRPLVVYFHGGGFVIGMLDTGDWLCGTVADRVGTVVVSVDYRLAPAHRFPAAVEDSYAVLAWAADSAEELGATGPIGVMGESAGGNLAAVACLIARERGAPAISHQALIYPATDLTDADGVKEAVPASTPFLSGAEMLAYDRLYLGPDGDPTHPWASPLLAEDHGGLPPALIQVAECDPLHDDGTRYAAALRTAGVPVRLTEYVDMPHGFVNFPGLASSARQAVAELCAEQSAALTAY